MKSFYHAQHLTQAYEWLCRRRNKFSCHADVWHLRIHWQEEKRELLKALQQKTYCFDAVQIYQLPDKKIGIWSARDALVLKMLAMHLREALDPVLNPNIYHLGGIHEQEKRGTRAAAKKVYEALPDNDFVFRTDVKGYYASIQHEVLWGLCCQYIQDPFILKLIRQYLRHHTYEDGIYRSIQKGISLGCPLSPIMGALCLKPLDDAMAKTSLFYIRYMDDWVILSPTRWKLRKAIAIVNQCLTDLRFEKHPDKTFIGRTDKGFDFLGYHFQAIKAETTSVTPASTDRTRTALADPGIDPASSAPPPTKTVSISISQNTIQQFLAKTARLYEQGASPERIERYRNRFLRAFDLIVLLLGGLYPWEHAAGASVLKGHKILPSASGGMAG